MAALLAAPFVAALTLASCGSSSSSSKTPAQTARATLTLQPATTYYWKVMDLYAGGGVTVSDTKSFTTPAK